MREHDDGLNSQGSNGKHEAVGLRQEGRPRTMASELMIGGAGEREEGVRDASLPGFKYRTLGG